MQPGRIFWCAFWIFAPFCAAPAASLDFAISTDLLSLYNRFGVDAQGNILIAANPGSCNLPTVNPLYTCGPIWIGKLDPSARTLLFATYLGNGATTPYAATVAGIAADADGNLIVAAHTTVPDLPTMRAFQVAPKSAATSLYVVKLSADGSRLLYATYLGGTGGQSATSLALDSAGAAYVAAFSSSVDFPSTPQSAHEFSPFPTVIAKLDPDGMLQYAVTFPYEFYADLKPLQVDALGNALLVSPVEVLTVPPDGSSILRTPLPEWANPTSACASQTGGSAACQGKAWAFPRTSGGFQFAGTSAGGVPVTSDAMQSYNDLNGYVRIQDGEVDQTQLTPPVSGLALDPHDGNRIYAATSTSLLVSEDNGSTWSVLRDGPSLAIAVDPFDSNRLYLSTDGVASTRFVPQVYRSTDRGATWTSIYSGGSQGNRILSLAADPNVPGLIYGAGGLVFRSTDGGDSWDSRSVGPSRPDISPSASIYTSSQFVQVDPTHPGWAYVVGLTRCIGFCPITQNLARTQDGGNTWTSTNPGPDPLTLTNPAGVVAIDPTTGDVWETINEFTAKARVVVFRGGDFSAPEILFPAETTAVAFDTANPGTIYLGVHIAQGNGSGYFVEKTIDGGLTWTRVVQLDRQVYGLTVGSGGVLHAWQTPNLPEGYVVVTDAAGKVEYGTYFGAAFTQINSVVSSGEKIFVAGKTQGGLPLVARYQSALGGGSDGFVAVFDASGSLLWSTYLGGSADDAVDWILPCADGSAVVVGTTNSSDFPWSAQSSPLGQGNTFIAHLRP